MIVEIYVNVLYVWLVMYQRHDFGQYTYGEKDKCTYNKYNLDMLSHDILYSGAFLHELMETLYGDIVSFFFRLGFTLGKIEIMR